MLLCQCKIGKIPIIPITLFYLDGVDYVAWRYLFRVCVVTLFQPVLLCMDYRCWRLLWCWSRMNGARWPLKQALYWLVAVA